MKAELVRVWPGVLSFLETPIPVSGRITDSTGGAVSSAEILLPEYKFHFKEQKPVRADGVFHLWVPQGKLKMQVKHSRGVHEEIVDVNAAGSYLHIKLPSE